MGQASASPVGTPRTSDPPSQDAGSTQRRREYDARIGKCRHTEGLGLCLKSGKHSVGWKGHQAEHHAHRNLCFAFLMAIMATGINYL